MPTITSIMNAPNEMSMAIRHRVPPFTSSSRRPLLTHALGHSQSPEPPNFVGASTAVRLGSESHRPLRIRLLDRCRGARAVRHSPSDVAACHRLVLTGTHSPVISGRATRAKQARAAPAGVHVSQPAPKTALKANPKARNKPKECLRSHAARPSRALFVTKRHKTPQNVTIW